MFRRSVTCNTELVSLQKYLRAHLQFSSCPDLWGGTLGAPVLVGNLLSQNYQEDEFEVNSSFGSQMHKASRYS